MTTFLQFMFTRADLEAMLETDMDFCVVNACYELVDDKDGKKRAALSVTADAVKGGNPEPRATRIGCPIPPCKPENT